MATQSLKERQEDELQVLQAIFMDDLEDMRYNDAWKVDRPPEIRLTLKPQQSIGNMGEVYTQLDLIVKCSNLYPDEVPEFQLENWKGLSNQQIAKLRTDLQEKVKQLKGQEMILELSQVVQTFLYSHNKPPPKSFYEEMMFNKRRQEEMQAEEQQKKLALLRKKEEKERQVIEEQIQRRQEALKEETRKRREENRQLNTQASEESSTGSSEPTTPSVEATCSPIGTPQPMRTRMSVSPSPVIVRESSEPAEHRPTRRRRTSTPRCAETETGPETHQCKDHTGGIVVLAFNTKTEKTVHRGTCLGHSAQGSTVYVGIDTSTGDLVAIGEWVLKWRHVARKNLALNRKSEYDKEGESYLKQILSIEQEVMSLIRLHHRNLVHYLAIKYQQETGKITVYLLMEFTGGHSLDVHLKKQKPVAVDLLRTYTEEILLALEYLHNKAVVHKNLRASSVFVDGSGKIRLADYSIDRRLHDLYLTVEQSKPGVKFAENKQPLALGRGGKKADIYQLGLLVLSLAQGNEVMETPPTIPTTYPPPLQDFLTKCLMPDERLRWSCPDLLEHSFVKDAIPMAIAPSVPTDNLRKADNENEEDDDVEDEALPLYITAWEATGQSRLTTEFDVLKSLGKGGFGDVIKVKNKLDGRLYAIKRIPLNPKSQQFNRKITREVKLLSRLNHENVVRYYNSWIETSEDPAESETSSSLSGTPKLSESPKVKQLPLHRSVIKNSLDMTDDVEKFAPQKVEDSVDFSISVSYEPSRRSMDVGLDTDDEDEEEEDVFGLSFLPMSDDSSDGVVFDHIDSEDNSCVQNAEKQMDDKNESSKVLDNTVPKLQYLYIQMEYCEKSTLRNCIDVGLYQDVNRVWRLFREIIEGLVHIHEQGMIHRDLKPVNIFLDSNDHVKIGDFGLATTDIIVKGALADASMLARSAADIHFSSSRSGSVGDGSLTGKVGTALYVSPEVMQRESRGTYNQKVDSYSLGVIFFEMCYKPLPTGMERVKILGSLRTPDVVFPEDFDQLEMENQSNIIRWLLNHDPTQRPTSKELLQSPYLPPPQMEEAELNEILRSTISDPHSKSYRKMISAIFSQTLSVADDHLYDSELHKGSVARKSLLISKFVYDTLERIFQRHGALKLSMPLLMPKPRKVYDKINMDHYVCLMDHGGQLVGLPLDLRVPFARYIAKNNVQMLKRYSIEKVYREKKFYGYHPRELIECAFDVVTNTHGSLIPDGEVLVLVQEVVDEFLPLQKRNYYIKVNHTSILKAVLLHVGVKEEQHFAVLTAWYELKAESQGKTKQNTLSTVANMSEQSSTMLMSLLETEGKFSKVSSILKCITKTKGQAATYAKQGLHEIEAVISNAEGMGLNMPVIVSLGWVYNARLFSGVFFQVAVDVKKKKRTMSEVFAVGGRYDHLISQFQSPAFSAVKSMSSHYAVGVSIAFEKIVIAMMDQEEFHPPSACDILVCTIGRKPMLKERMALMKELWAAGLKADVHLETLEGQEEIQDFCRSTRISQLVLLKDTEGGSVKVRSIEHENKITEKIVQTSKLVEFLLQKLQTSIVDGGDQQQASSGKGGAVVSQQDVNVPSQPSSGGNVSMNFTFVMQDGKLQANVRKKYEALIVAKVNTCLPWLAVKCVEVLSLDLNVSVLKTIVAFLDIDGNESAFEASISSVVEKYPKYKKYMSKITDHIHQLVFVDRCTCIVLYGIKDDSVKLLTVS